MLCVIKTSTEQITLNIAPSTTVTPKLPVNRLHRPASAPGNSPIVCKGPSSPTDATVTTTAAPFTRVEVGSGQSQKLTLRNQEPSSPRWRNVVCRVWGRSTASFLRSFSRCRKLACVGFGEGCCSESDAVGTMTRPRSLVTTGRHLPCCTTGFTPVPNSDCATCRFTVGESGWPGVDLRSSFGGGSAWFLRRKRANNLPGEKRAAFFFTAETAFASEATVRNSRLFRYISSSSRSTLRTERCVFAKK
mmetsp:Transcript_12343/g.29942  ORF Transcript_12343/g.29942 Transcript_12343/m.29942 type:complete len:247 (+) Transcript_12343:511-1251(+)